MENRSTRPNTERRKPSVGGRSFKDDHSGEIVNGSTVPGETVTDALNALAASTSTGLMTHEATVAAPGPQSLFAIATPFVAGKIKVYKQGIRQSLANGHYAEASGGVGITNITMSVPVVAGTLMIFDY